MVRARAAGVNRADLLQRQGAYGTENFGDSPLLGLELAGEVMETGEEVTGFRRGDWVMAITGGGAYAEVARVDQGMAVRMPEHLGFIEAAAVMFRATPDMELCWRLGDGPIRRRSVTRLQ
nr:alcohol dehydrogenase catalytic domain-containing protein [Azospirillum aestuarii]